LRLRQPVPYGLQIRVVVLKGFIDLERKCRRRQIDTAAGKRQLDRAAGVPKLPATDLKRIQMLVTPAEGDLQGSVQLRQSRLFSDQ
jgi:hypothetical protein